MLCSNIWTVFFLRIQTWCVQLACNLQLFLPTDFEFEHSLVSNNGVQWCESLGTSGWFLGPAFWSLGHMMEVTQIYPKTGEVNLVHFSSFVYGTGI